MCLRSSTVCGRHGELRDRYCSAEISRCENAARVGIPDIKRQRTQSTQRCVPYARRDRPLTISRRPKLREGARPSGQRCERQRRDRRRQPKGSSTNDHRRRTRRRGSRAKEAGRLPSPCLLLLLLFLFLLRIFETDTRPVRVRVRHPASK